MNVTGRAWNVRDTYLVDEVVENEAVHVEVLLNKYRPKVKAGKRKPTYLIVLDAVGALVAQLLEDLVHRFARQSRLEALKNV